MFLHTAASRRHSRLTFSYLFFHSQIHQDKVRQQGQAQDKYKSSNRQFFFLPAELMSPFLIPLFTYCGTVFAFFNRLFKTSYYFLLQSRIVVCVIACSFVSFKYLHAALLWSLTMCFIMLNSVGYLFIRFPNLSPSSFCSVFSRVLIITPCLILGRITEGLWQSQMLSWTRVLHYIEVKVCIQS